MDSTNPKWKDKPLCGKYGFNYKTSEFKLIFDKQINDYLCHQAIGEIKNNLTTNKESHWDTYQNYYYIGLATLLIAFILIIKIKARRLKKIAKKCKVKKHI